MRSQHIWIPMGLLIFVLIGTTAPADEPSPSLPLALDLPKFRMQEIDTALKIGYAVVLEDLDGDGKKDIVVVDQFKIVWYHNPTWKKRVILDGKTKPDNVCICALDIDGGGDLELVIGAGWKPFDTKTPGTLQWLKRGASLDDHWTMHLIPCDEPTVHRVRAIDLDGDGRPEIVHVPLMGRDATRDNNWLDGRPVRVMAYKVPADPTKPEHWKPFVLSDELHVCHNFWPITNPGSKSPSRILTASYEGYSSIEIGKPGSQPVTRLVHEGNQSNPKSNRGASEIRSGRLTDGSLIVGTIEPWHGHQVVVYTGREGEKPTRTVLDDHLRWGHAVSFADLDGDGGDELIVGVRDNPSNSDRFTEKRGIRIYRRAGSTWSRGILDDGGVAVEDLAVGDLDGDGRPDIVAVGRQTMNCRIYWNQGR